MKLKSLVFLLIIKVIFTQPPEDKIELPNYPYTKNTYGGYLEVTANKSLFYIYHEADQNSESLPLLLWLNGGPLCSSLGGWADEIGPCYLENGQFVLNDYSWNKLANLFFIESPAGTGFSYINSTNESDFYFNDDLVAQENLIALQSFFKKFPSLKDKDFYISGESYAGIYIPMLALEILNYNNKVGDEKKINLKGILIGNGVADWNYDNYPAIVDFLFSHHFYSYETRMELLQCLSKEKNKTKCKQDIYNYFEKIYNKLNIYDILQDCYTGEQNQTSLYSNYAKWAFSFKQSQSKPEKNEEPTQEETSAPCLDSHYLEEYLNKEEVQEALHIINKTKWNQCGNKLIKYVTQEKGSIYAYPYLLDKIRILIYSGDTDMAVPFNGNQAWIRNLKLPIISDWKPWRAYDLDGNVDMENIAGYRTIYQGLIFTTIKGTGHMVPQWKRKEAFYMVKQFLNNEDF